jgi:DNA-binding response OmpR family regulator
MAKILIVDDDEDIVETTQFSLKARGYNCIVAFDGLSALKLAKTSNPDLIVLDIMLPKLDGFKVARLLKFDTAYRHIPIIMLTAKALAQDRKLGEEAGADVYLTKPFDMAELLEIVGRYLGAREEFDAAI